jgi:hypothetical protein
VAIFNRAARCALMALVALCFSHTVAAEPITLNFRADITQQCTYPICQSVEHRVPFTIRFDTANGRIDDFGNQAFRTYLALSVTIPLPGQGQAGAIPDPNGGPYIAARRTPTDDGRWEHDTEIAAGEIFEGKFDDNEDSVVAWQLFMYKQALESAKPTLFISDYVRFLGRGPLEFSYSFNTPNAQGWYTGTGYSGTATLLTELQPVPEPTSWLLLASGLGALGARKWQRKRATTS